MLILQAQEIKALREQLIELQWFLCDLSPKTGA
jgi:hypothetical protein